MVITTARSGVNIIDTQNTATDKVVVPTIISRNVARVTVQNIPLTFRKNNAPYNASLCSESFNKKINAINPDDVHKPEIAHWAAISRMRENYGIQRYQLKNFPSRTLAFRQMYNDLRAFDFTNINRNKYERGEFVAVDFSYANLEGADLTLAWLNGSNFTYARLNSAKLFIHSANFFGAALNGAQIILDLPCQWSDNYVDTLLIWPGRCEAVLHTIASVSDAYRELKLALMQQLIDYTITHTGATDQCSLLTHTFIKNILAKEFYMDNPMIKGFVSGLIQNVINQSSGQVTLNTLSNSTLSNIIKFIFETDEQSELQCDVIANNGFFIQLIVRSAYSDNPTLQRQARNLYATYLTHEQIKPFTEKEEFGDGAGRPDWSDPHSLNYILVSGQKNDDYRP